MLDEAGHDFAEATGLWRSEGFHHFLRQQVLVVIGHEGVSVE
jgi:hypothetical protein